MGAKTPPQIGLQTLSLFMLAIPAWCFVLFMLAGAPAFRGAQGVIPPLVLIGITVALQRLFRGRPQGWAVAALLAPIIAVAVLYTAAFLSR